MGIGNSKHDGLEEILKVRPDGSIVKYKTSIFGWGKLQHPVKVAPEGKSKKKKKWVDPTENMQVPPVEPVKGGGNESPLPPQRRFQVRSPKGLPPSKSTENIPLVRLKADAGNPLDRMLKRKSVPNSSGKTLGIQGGSGSARKWSFKAFKIDNIPKGKNLAPIPTEAISPSTPSSTPSRNGTGAYYYGQYRCGKCRRYWRSGLAQDGVAQKCSKCGTATLPTR